jgi:hypothetical protein
MIDEKMELMGQSPYWVWTKAQLKVNQQRDTIDLLLCDLVKAVLENEEAQNVEERNTSYEENKNANIKSFISAALGALVVNMFYYYLKI